MYHLVQYHMSQRPSLSKSEELVSPAARWLRRFIMEHLGTATPPIKSELELTTAFIVYVEFEE